MAEDPLHAINTLVWLRRLEPQADAALCLAAYTHDIDRADERTKVRREQFADYDSFKAAHAEHSAAIVRAVLAAERLPGAFISDCCELIRRHEVGGCRRSDLLRDADSISYFDVNLPLYYQREGWDESLRRCRWGWRRLSPAAQQQVLTIRHADPRLNELIALAARTA
ncbi:MAG: DUF4202 family protein [Spongiibacteraceae bacterium]|nr:DUF4202 family protein [Spongiibacteraceae bacterium]